MTLKEVQQIAKNMGITPKKMNKTQLIQTIQTPYGIAEAAAVTPADSHRGAGSQLRPNGGAGGGD